jgi:hypothetical protein
MYSWRDVARRTEAVYDAMPAAPSLTKRLRRYRSCGPFAGLLGCAVALLLASLVALLDAIDPRKDIEAAPSWCEAGRAKGDKGDGGNSSDESESASDERSLE